MPVIDLKEKIIDDQKEEKIKIDKGNIEFQNINFDYDDKNKPVLKNLNLIITGGKMTSLVGHSGAGKQQSLIGPRFYDPKSEI